VTDGCSSILQGSKQRVLCSQEPHCDVHVSALELQDRPAGCQPLAHRLPAAVGSIAVLLDSCPLCTRPRPGPAPLPYSAPQLQHVRMRQAALQD
jgi:hypothetical protein